MSIPAVTDPPELVRALAGDREIVAVWVNDLGGVTYLLGDDEYVKWFRGEHWEVDFPAEAERMRWAAGYLPVPRVIDVGERDGQQWLRTEAIAAESAVHPHNAADPARTVPALARGLRVWHDTVPVAQCPYRWDVATRLAARPDGDALPAAAALRELAGRMEQDLVVCRGDACAPNFLVDGTEVVGHVDLGRLGVGDRWADLAPALLSLRWNYGPGWDDAFLAAYGIALDRDKYDYYCRLWDLA